VIRPHPTSEYPPDWPEIARRVKDEAGWRCVRCHAPHSVEGWRILTVHHLDGDKGNCRWWNLAALCQRCHLQIQAKVRMEQAYLHPHSVWFRPYVAGFYAFAIMGEDLSRTEVEARLDELLLTGQPWLEVAR
jgi:5-methylcytosine-specific restriction endonuclease McrA